MKRNLLTTLIIITAVLTGTVKAFGNAQVQQRLLTAAEPAVAITKVASNENGNINAATGVHSGLNASFKLNTNSGDGEYDYFLTSSTPISGYSDSAFGVSSSTGQKLIVFVNTSHEPTAAAIENAKFGGTQNNDAISYPIEVTIDSPMTAEYVSNHHLYGNCWKIRVNSANQGILTNTVLGAPINGTYTVGKDSTGTYQAVVTFTAVSK